MASIHAMVPAAVADTARTMAQKPVIIRQVWASNLTYEFSLIQKAIPLFSVVSLDTEFPGTVFKSNIRKHLLSQAHPYYIYYLMKQNVDLLNLIQLGLALSDSDGNLPSFGTEFCYVWQFNFRDFDVQCDPHDSDSIQLLKTQGMNFQMNREKGIDSWEFAASLVNSGLVMNKYPSLTWVTFHGGYDLGFLIKILTGQSLPNEMESFFVLVYYYLGVRVYDIKYMMMNCVREIHGGLERVANLLGVNRVAGNSHQAGSDSLLTLQTFMKFKNLFLNHIYSYTQSFNGSNFNGYEGLLYGLSPRTVQLWNPSNGSEGRIIQDASNGSEGIVNEVGVMA